MPGISEKVRQMAGITNWVHPAVALLPPPSGSTAHLSFQEAPSQDGEIQHQCELSFPEQSVGKDFSLAEAAGLTVAKQKPPAFVAPASSGPVYSKEQLKEWGYPAYDPKFDDPEWLSQQLQREQTDPRENPNFFLSHEDPRFWNNAARKPHMKALLQSDDHWKLRKNTWLEQFQQVKQSNDFRREVADALEECSMATRRLVGPILHCRPVESHLMQVVGQSRERGVPFPQLVETAEHQRILMDFRNTFDHEGEAGIHRIFQDWHHREIKQSEERKQLAIVPAESSMKELQDGLGFASKYRKDGVVQWERGNHEDALKAWRLGCEALQRIRVPDTHPSEQKFFSEVKVALLKNRALAALKLNSWQEALDSSEQVLKLDDQDHKAWFRKACALEGLGRLQEVEACLSMIDSIAVGRPDRDRIEQETMLKREKVKALIDRDQASQQRMLRLGLQKCLFSEEREASTSDAAVALEDAPAQRAELPRVDDLTRKRLTKDGAEDMLKDLELAYSDATFREQVRKLARDVRNKDEFSLYLNKVALPIQQAVLERWGFEATEVGVIEMQMAIEDHTKHCEQLKRRATQTQRVLYGEMYHAVHGNGSKSSSYTALPEKERLKQAEKRLQRRLNREDSDEEQDVKQDASRLYAHWSQPSAAKPDPSASAASAASLRASQEAEPAAALPTRLGSPANRKEIWADLTKAQKAGDVRQLRATLEKAVASGFSAVTIRSAKQKLLQLGGNIDGL